MFGDDVRGSGLVRKARSIPILTLHCRSSMHSNFHCFHMPSNKKINGMSRVLERKMKRAGRLRNMCFFQRFQLSAQSTESIWYVKRARRWGGLAVHVPLFVPVILASESQKFLCSRLTFKRCKGIFQAMKMPERSSTWIMALMLRVETGKEIALPKPNVVTSYRLFDFSLLRWDFFSSPFWLIGNSHTHTNNYGDFENLLIIKGHFCERLLPGMLRIKQRFGLRKDTEGKVSIISISIGSFSFVFPLLSDR